MVRSDDFAIGRLGAEHFLERGLRHFAFCELAIFWSKRRREGFETRLAESGYDVHHLKLLKPTAGPGGPAQWEQEQIELAGRLRALPKPVGIMATNDFMGRQILEACQRFGLQVPDEVAVLGVDNDEPLCRISMPMLSSVIINDAQRGYEAANILAGLMEGRQPTARRVLILPAGIKTRASTDILAIDDDAIAQSLRHLKTHVGRHVDIDALAGEVGLSRSTLERKFRRQLGRSIHDEIDRLRTEYAVQLLSETELQIKAIAIRCGYSNQSHMNTVFQKEFGRTPGSFRK